jgi:hypothetical protein
MRLLPGILIALILAVALSACGEGDEAEPTTAQSDLARYCDLSRELDQAGQEQFQSLEDDPDATGEDFAAAERALVEENEDALNEIQEIAPPEIRDHAVTLVTALRVRAGVSDAQIDPADAEDAEKAIDDFEKENC